jgi:dienelactone hydrolase
VLTPRRSLVAAVLVVLVLAGLGLWLRSGAGGDTTRRHSVVAGVPLDEVHPPTRAERRPAVVVAHGFAGSAELMAQFGDTLSARGYVVVLLDFAGHGANTHPLPDAAAATDAAIGALQHDLDVATAYVRRLPDVDPARIALVGHSMGASAVTRYAVAHPDIAATVAISLPDASTVRPDLPSRLLVLVGALEFPDFHAEAERAAEPAGPDRAMVVVPAVEHISILYAARTHRETADWLDAGFGRDPADRSLPSPVRRLAGAGVLMLALLAGMYPLARLLFGAGGGRNAPGRPTVRALVVAVVATAVAAPIARLLPTNHLPLAVGGYVIGFTATAGALMLAYHRLRGETRSNDAGTSVVRRRPAVAAPLLIGYAAATIAVPMQLGLTHAVPVGARWWLLALVWGGFAVLAYAGERIAGGNSVGVLAVSAVAVIGLTGAAVVGITYGFVLLVVPLLAVLLVFQAVWSAVLNRFAAPPWLIALVGSLLVAWPIATALPVIG